MLKDLQAETAARMAKATASLESDLRTIRTGRASPALLERVTVEYYGMKTPLNQLAVISAPEPQLLTVRPFDPGSVQDIERGILTSDVGLTPSNDGRIIRLPIPPLTEERRQKLARLVRLRLEEGKVALRNIRREALEDLRQFESEKLVSEDEFFEGKQLLQDLIDQYSAQMDEVGASKQHEILEG